MPPSSPTSTALRALAGGAAAVAAGVGYAVAEREAFLLRRYDVPVLPAGSRPLRVLQISDAHFTPGRRRLRDFLGRLAALQPDLVVNTGDNAASDEGVTAVAEAMEPLLRYPGVFVMGSNDYWAPKPKNPARYLLPDDGRRVHGRPLPWQKLRDAMTAAGWLDVDNATGSLEVAGHRLWFGGVDDPHIRRDDYRAITGPVPPDAALAIGVTHSPEPRVLDAFVTDGYRLLLGGHTHGGQLRLPFYGALVTNCGLDRRRARGLHRWGMGLEPAWLHVSAGLGTSPYAPVRFSCPPEASLLTLRPRGR